MIANWVKNILSTLVPTEAIGQGAKTFEKKTQERLTRAVEVDEEELTAVLSEDAIKASIKASEDVRRRGAAFLKAVSGGGSRVDRLRIWLTVRRKVRKGLSGAYEGSPEVMDEVTDRILEAAQFDPRIRKLFR